MPFSYPPGEDTDPLAPVANDASSPSHLGE